MLTELLTNLRDIVNAIYDAFLLPGEFVLSKFTVLAPRTAMKLGIGTDVESALWAIIFSLFAWLLLALLLRWILRLCENLLRTIVTAMRIIAFRMTLAAGNLKTWIVCKLRLLLPRRAKKIDVLPQIEFDDLDLAVLRSAAARGPGFATSAPEIADLLTLRPAQVQRSLDKLSANKMLEYVIGSTDGYDNYRLSALGTAFMANWQRQHSSA